jgi:hypothetical protein
MILPFFKKIAMTVMTPARGDSEKRGQERAGATSGACARAAFVSKTIGY